MISELFSEQELVACATDFFHFAQKYVNIPNWKRGLIPFEKYAFHDRILDAYENHRFVLVPKFRQGGFTTFNAVWAFWKCLTKCDQRIMFLVKTDRDAIYTSHIIKHFVEHLPPGLLPKFKKFNDHQISLEETDSTLYFHTPQASCGREVTALIIDEAAFISDIEQHWKAMWPTLSTGGRCIVTSTPNGIGNWFSDCYLKSLTGVNPFKIVNVRHDEHPDFQDKKVLAEYAKNLGTKGFLQEVLCNFLT